MGQCCSCVEAGTVAIITKWGAFNMIAEEGFNCYGCPGYQVAALLNLR